MEYTRHYKIHRRINATISCWLRKARFKSQLSLEEASTRLQLSPYDLESYEGGKPIPLKILTKIVKLYQADWEDVLGLI